MRFIRSLVFYLWLTVSTVLYLPVIIAALPLSPQRRWMMMAFWSRCAIVAVRLCCGVRYEVVGAHRIPRRPVVFLSRHESAWETLAFQSILPPQAIVVKKELLRIPIFGWGLLLMSGIPIDRQLGRQALRRLEQRGLAAIAAGFCVLVFPEGSRMSPGQCAPFSAGGAWLAKTAGVSAVPIWVDSGRCWGRRAFVKNAGVVTVRIGEAIDTGGQSVRQINAQAKAWIDAQVRAAAGSVK